MKVSKHDLKAEQTSSLLHSAAAAADGGVMAILRHSARHYPQQPEQEAFMTLTEEGKSFASDLGAALAREMKPRLFSSFITRCIETAYLVATGYAMTHGLFPAPPAVGRELTPFYLNDIPAAVARQQQVGHDTYLRMWLDGKLPVAEIEAPEASARAIARFMTGVLDDLPPGEIGIGITHDWNIFPVKEFLLHQPHEQAGQIGYLEAVVLFRQAGELFLQGICGDKVRYEP
ncbi:MAG: histidine phosphatase family protein [Desulfobacterales bacterium]|nr:MAG: histidine phosphatase family protein [Desulfobacterales bacterium]